MKITITEDVTDRHDTEWVAEVPDGAQEVNVSVQDGTGVTLYVDGKYIPLEEEES